MRNFNTAGDQSSKSQLMGHFHNPSHTNDKIPSVNHQFAVNIPLEADEYLCSPPGDGNSVQEKEVESNPLNVMLGRRTLLKSEPVPSSSPLAAGDGVLSSGLSGPGGILVELYNNVDSEEIVDLDMVDYVEDPFIEYREEEYATDRNISNIAGRFPNYRNDDTTTTFPNYNNPTAPYKSSLAPAQIDPNRYDYNVADTSVHAQVSLTYPSQTTAVTLATGQSYDYNSATNQEQQHIARPSHNYDSRVDGRPFLSSNQPQCPPPVGSHIRSGGHPHPGRTKYDHYRDGGGDAIDKNVASFYANVQKTPVEQSASGGGRPGFDYYSEYPQNVGFFDAGNQTAIAPNPSSSIDHNHHKPRATNYNTTPPKRHISSETVSKELPKEDPYETDSGDTFVEQIARIYITDRPTPRDQEKTKPCNCQKTGCLKLYCECFARGESCLNCSCKCCLNTPNDFEHWLKASNLVKSRRKTLLAMSPKNSYANKLRRGCNCRRSLCLKKYCECYDKKIPCNKYCRCIDCCNGPDSQHIRKLKKSQKPPESNDSISSNASPGRSSNRGNSTLNRNSSYTDESKTVFYSDLHSSEAESSARYPHHSAARSQRYAPAMTSQQHRGNNHAAFVHLASNHSGNSKQSTAKLHSSQSSNDLVNRAETSSGSRLPSIPAYTKSSSTPNLLKAYSIEHPSRSNIGGHPQPSSIASRINDEQSHNRSEVNNKKMMNQYLSLIARNPHHKG